MRIELRSNLLEDRGIVQNTIPRQSVAHVKAGDFLLSTTGDVGLVLIGQNAQHPNSNVTAALRAVFVGGNDAFELRGDEIIVSREQVKAVAESVATVIEDTPTMSAASLKAAAKLRLGGSHLEAAGLFPNPRNETLRKIFEGVMKAQRTSDEPTREALAKVAYRAIMSEPFKA